VRYSLIEEAASRSEVFGNEEIHASTELSLGESTIDAPGCGVSASMPSMDSQENQSRYVGAFSQPT
jgi:hypothetical protein